MWTSLSSLLHCPHLCWRQPTPPSTAATMTGARIWGLRYGTDCEDEAVAKGMTVDGKNDDGCKWIDSKLNLAYWNVDSHKNNIFKLRIDNRSLALIFELLLNNSKKKLIGQMILPIFYLTNYYSSCHFSVMLDKKNKKDSESFTVMINYSSFYIIIIVYRFFYMKCEYIFLWGFIRIVWSIKWTSNLTLLSTVLNR